METLSVSNPIMYSHEELKDMTDNFSEANLFGETQFGKVYRGQTEQGQDVTVKIWEEIGPWRVRRDEHCFQLKDECDFLTEPSIHHHPNLPKLLGYCWEDNVLGVVYDLKPLDTLPNLIPRDDFSWLQRMKVAIDLARLIEFLQSHEPPYLVRNIGSPHIMVDQDYNAVILDFGIITGGVFGRNFRRIPSNMHHGLLGYADPVFVLTGQWMMRCDAFSFGSVLLELISKRVYNRDHGENRYPVSVWANDEYEKKKKKKKMQNGALKFSLVHSSLEKDPKFSENDGYVVTKVALECAETECRKVGPKINDVVRSLEGLDAAHFLNELGNQSDASRC